MSLSAYVTRNRVGLKRSFYTALGITAGAAASLYAQRQLALPPDEERAGPPPAVLRAKVPWALVSACCAMCGSDPCRADPDRASPQSHWRLSRN